MTSESPSEGSADGPGGPDSAAGMAAGPVRRAQAALVAPRSAEQVLRLLEPLALAALCVNGLVELSRAAAGARTVAAVGVLGLLLAWASFAFLRDRPVGHWPAWARGIAAFATGAVLFHPTGTTEFVWIIATVGVYPIALARHEALLFGVAAAVLDALALHGGTLGGFDALQHAATFVVFAFFANLLGLAVTASGRALEKTARSRSRFNAVTANAALLIQIVEDDLGLAYVNPYVQTILGYSEAELRKLWGTHLIHPDDLPALSEAVETLRGRANARAVLCARVRHKDGSWRWFEAHATNLLDNPAVRGIVVTSVDVTDHIQAEQRLFEERNRFRTVIEAVPEFIFAKDIEGRYTMSNVANVRRLGMENERELVGRQPREIYPPNVASEIERDDRRVLESGEPILGQQVLRDWTGQGRPRWLEMSKIPLRDQEGQVTGLVGISRDIHAQKEIESMLAHQASHDALTGLPNRRYLVRELEAALASGTPCALLYCDLDFFKSVNDHFGHEVGDRFLVNLADRIKLCLGAKETLVRLGGDEFIILSREILDEAEAMHLARRVLKAVQQPLVVENATLRVEASIGIALSRADDRRPEDLIRNADAAMYKAKEEGRSRIAVFDELSRQRAVRHAQLAQSLQHALDRHELSLVYQPKISLRDGRLTGFEALLRWHSPEHGEVPPSAFVPIAEQSALISSIGLWTLQEACWQFCTWQRRHPHAGPMSLAINVSMRQMLTDSFVLDVQRIIEQTGVDPSSIELEVTETAVMANPNRCAHMLAQLKELGVRIALDDFGTGYSSLAYIRRLPIDVIKVDRAFVDGLGREQNDTEIVRLVLALASALRLETVAEGIETPESLHELIELGCDIGQGYLLSPPIDAEAARALFASAPAPIVAAQEFGLAARAS